MGYGVVDTGHDVVVVVEPPAPPRPPAEVLAVPGRGARVGVEHHVALRGQKLTVEREVVAVGAVGSPVHQEDHGETADRGRAAVAPCREHPALDFGAVFAPEEQAIGTREVEFGQQRVVDRTDATLARVGARAAPASPADPAARADAGAPPQPRRRPGSSGSVTVKAIREKSDEKESPPRRRSPSVTCSTVPPPAGTRNRCEFPVTLAEKYIWPPSADTVAPPGNEVPVLGEVAHALAAAGVEHEQVRRCSTVACLADDHVQALVAPYDDLAAVGRPRGPPVVVLVVGQPGHRAVDGDHPQVGALVAVLVALVSIGREGDAGAVGTPRQSGGVHAQVRSAAALRRRPPTAERSRAGAWPRGLGDRADSRAGRNGSSSSRRRGHRSGRPCGARNPNHRWARACCPREARPW